MAGISTNKPNHIPKIKFTGSKFEHGQHKKLEVDEMVKRDVRSQKQMAEKRAMEAKEVDQFVHQQSARYSVTGKNIE